MANGHAYELPHEPHLGKDESLTIENCIEARLVRRVTHETIKEHNISAFDIDRSCHTPLCKGIMFRTVRKGKQGSEKESGGLKIARRGFHQLLKLIVPPASCYVTIAYSASFFPFFPIYMDLFTYSTAAPREDKGKANSP
jgi:hypothetical protein